jgi:hypothetical protein
VRKPSPEKCGRVLGRIQSSDVTIISENYMQTHLDDSHTEVPKILSLQSRGTHSILRSIDPIGIDYPSFKIEIAKNLTQSLTLLNRFLVPQQHRLICIVPISESAESEAFKYAMKLQSEVEGLLISLNYRSKEIQKLIPVDSRKLKLANLLDSGVDFQINGFPSYVVTQDYEEDSLQNLIMTSRYRNLISTRLALSPVVVFTEPFRPHETENPLAIFSCLYADEIITIS